MASKAAQSRGSEKNCQVNQQLTLGTEVPHAAVLRNDTKGEHIVTARAVCEAPARLHLAWALQELGGECYHLPVAHPDTQALTGEGACPSSRGGVRSCFCLCGSRFSHCTD